MTKPVNSDNPDLTTWLHREWNNGACDKIEVWQTISKNMRGDKIFHRDFKPNMKSDVEFLAKITNEIMFSCQQDATAGDVAAYYIVDFHDFNRTANPVTMRIGPFGPKSKVQNMNSSHVNNDSLENIIEMFLDHIKEERHHTNHIVSETMNVMKQVIDEQRRMAAEGIRALLNILPVLIQETKPATNKSNKQNKHQATK